MPAAPIRYFHRYKKTVETEEVYGEKWLRWTYETAPGQLALALVVRRAIFSKWYGWRMNKRLSGNRVLPFIARYDVDVDEFAKSAFAFRTFNEFFYRALKPAARPVAADPRAAVFPADGRHLALPEVERAAGFYVKGQRLALAELLGDAALAEKFRGGAMLVSRLCPMDYHRFHFPVAGTPGDARLINGWLYSVSPVALRRNLRYLVENKRMVTLVESPEFGPVACLEVGATNVGGILQTYRAGRAAKKGEEKGLFRFGGSCVITLFQAGRIRFDADVIEQSAQCVETYAKMGDRVGMAAQSV